MANVIIEANVKEKYTGKACKEKLQHPDNEAGLGKTAWEALSHPFFTSL
jgi:hypothetical protein